jgi:hypothetical protein
MPYSRKRLPGYGETMNPKRSRQLAHSWHRPAFSYTIVAVESCSWYAKCYFTELTLSLCHRIEDGTDQPIAFALRSLSPPEKNYAQLDCEALAIFYGLTPMISLLNTRYMQIHETHGQCSTLLLFANKREEDILWREQLEELCRLMPQ